MFAEQATLLVTLQDEPPVSPLLLVIIAILLIILFIWLLLREKRKREAAELEAAKKLAARTASLAAPAPPTRAETIATLLDETPIAPVVDDLQIIEGIGPKIASILKAVGVTSFAQLAAMEPSEISAILQAANLRLADPQTWPEQARLAGAGKFDELKEFIARQRANRGG